MDAFEAELKKEGTAAHIEPLRQLLGVKSRLATIFKAKVETIMRQAMLDYGPHKLLVISSADKTQIKKLLKASEVFQIKVKGKVGNRTVAEMSERQLRELVRRKRPRETGRPPGGSLDWMDYLQRLHGELVPVAERLENAQQRWHVTRLESVGVTRGKRTSGMKLSQLQELMDVLADG